MNGWKKTGDGRWTQDFIIPAPSEPRARARFEAMCDECGVKILGPVAAVPPPEPLVYTDVDGFKHTFLAGEFGRVELKRQG